MKYRTIVADPPWKYGDSNQARSLLPSNGKRVSDLGYAAMPTEAIAALPVRDFAERDAHLYIWTTNAFMVEAHEIARAWGFTPKTILTWGKVCHDNPLQPSMRTGYYFRGATEHVVFATRGSLPVTGTWPTLFLWPRIGHHSVKPEAFIDLVEQASPGPYLELFSRRHRMGWDVWGNESANTATLPVEAA